MAGKVRKLIEELIHLRARGAPALEHFVKVNLVLNGIDPDRFGDTTPDEPEKIAKLEKMIRDFKNAQRTGVI